MLGRWPELEIDLWMGKDKEKVLTWHFLFFKCFLYWNGVSRHEAIINWEPKDQRSAQASPCGELMTDTAFRRVVGVLGQT